MVWICNFVFMRFRLAERSIFSDPWSPNNESDKFACSIILTIFKIEVQICF